MSSDLFTIRFDSEPSPWFSKYIEISFKRSKIQHVVDELVLECSNKNFSASYQYDPIVDKIVKKNFDVKCGDIRPFLKAISYLLDEQCPESERSNWSNGYVAALRSIKSKIAWSTPGFAEARRYNDMYGG